MLGPFRPTRKSTPALLLLALILLVAGIFFFTSRVSGVERYATAVIEKCHSEKDRAACYEREVPALMDNGISMDDAFAVTRRVQELDTEFRYCHLLAHNISAREASKDLSHWKDVIARSPQGLCGNGGLHGAFQERFRDEPWTGETEDIIRELSGVCDPRDAWNPTFLERSSCMHGLGHLLMFATAADIRQSVELCGVFGTGGDGFRRTCIDGAFMQIFQPVEPEDESLVADVVRDLGSREEFCAGFTSIARTSCLKESWPLDPDSILSGRELSGLCAPLLSEPDEYRYCASGLVYVSFGRIGYNAAHMMQLCADTPPEFKNICVARTASRFIETDWKNIPEALGVCAAADSETKESCYAELAEFAEQGLPPNSAERKKLCGGMPDQWRKLCSA